jgi:hypothetical protein
VSESSRAGWEDSPVQEADELDGDEGDEVDPALIEPPGQVEPTGYIAPVLCGALLAMTSVAAAIWLWAESVPGGNFLIQVALALGALVLAFCWCCLAIYVGARRVWGPRVRGGVALLVTAAVVLATAALTAGHVPLRLRFELSRGAFDQAVVDGRAAVDAASPEELSNVFEGTRDRAIYLNDPGRVGWYRASAVLVDNDGTWVSVATACCGHAGFGYSPDGLPEWIGESSDTGISSLDLGGGWFAHWSGVD